MEQNSQSFEALQKLLTLKRHEIPPPRFFEELPTKIMSRVALPQASSWEELLDRLFALRWFQTTATAAMALLVGTLLVLAVVQPASPSGPSTSANLIPPAVFAPSDSSVPSGSSNLFSPK